MGNKWMVTFIANFVAANRGREPSKGEIKNATPLFVNTSVNPKGKGSQAWTRFNGYLDEAPTTIGEAFAAGLRQDDIRHDSDKRFILLGDEALEAMKEEADAIAAENAVAGEHTEVLLLTGPEVEPEVPAKKTRSNKAK